MAPVVHELTRRSDKFETFTLTTGQHRELLDQVLKVFDLTADVDLEVMTPGQTLTEVTVRCLSKLEEVLPEIQPDMVLVHGDTATTLATSLASFYQQIPIGHVESGLRTFDRYQPFPEEMNRVLTDHMCSLHFAPTPLNRDHLKRESLSGDGVFVTGNTAIDALLSVTSEDYEFCNPKLQEQPWGERKLILCDLHRRENFGQPMRNVLQGLARLMSEYIDSYLVVSVHPNPQVSAVIREELESVDRTLLVEPLDYREWANLMASSHFLVTDSGGLQEEAPALGIPVLLAREKTERPEAVTSGTVKKVGTDRSSLVSAGKQLLASGEMYESMVGTPNPYGDGRAAGRIADALEWHWGLRSEQPNEFKSPVQLTGESEVQL